MHHLFNFKFHWDHMSLASFNPSQMGGPLGFAAIGGYANGNGGRGSGFESLKSPRKGRFHDEEGLKHLEILIKKMNPREEPTLTPYESFLGGVQREK